MGILGEAGCITELLMVPDVKSEREFREALPRLLLSLYTQKLRVEIMIDSDTVISMPLELYIPELRLAIETDEMEKSSDNLKEYICEKAGISLERRRGCLRFTKVI